MSVFERTERPRPDHNRATAGPRSSRGQATAGAAAGPRDRAVPPRLSYNNLLTKHVLNLL